MTSAVPVALFGFIPLVLVVFLCFRPRTAVLVSFIGGWLFLPVAGYKLAGMPDYNKNMAISVSVLLGVCVFDLKRLTSFRPSVIDLPVLTWCLAPGMASISNDLGTWDALSAIFAALTSWVLPYVIGRAYFDSPLSIAELLFGIIIGALIYAPLCWFEIRFSPQLHRTIYGYHQHSFGQTKRWGGFRPMVFLPHGLSVGIWMCAAVISGTALWLGGIVRRIWGWPAGAVLSVLAVTSIACKSTGSLLLTIIGVTLLVSGRRWRASVPVIILLSLGPLYMVTRGTGIWSGEQLITLSGEVVGNDRAGSLGYRIKNETRLAAKAMERPLLGWGRWSRGRVFNEHGKDVSVTDGLWIIALSQNGALGLFGMTATMLAPALLALKYYPAQKWMTAEGAIIGCAIILSGLFLIDALFNATLNVVFMLITGGLAGVVAAFTSLRPAEPQYQTQRRRRVLSKLAMREPLSKQATT